MLNGYKKNGNHQKTLR